MSILYNTRRYFSDVRNASRNAAMIEELGHFLQMREIKVHGNERPTEVAIDVILEAFDLVEVSADTMDRATDAIRGLKRDVNFAEFIVPMQKAVIIEAIAKNEILHAGLAEIVSEGAEVKTPNGTTKKLIRIARETIDRAETTYAASNNDNETAEGLEAAA